MVRNAVNIEITSNASLIANILERRINKLESSSKSVVREVSQWGKFEAMRIMPKYSGATSKAVNWTKGKTPASATIIFGNGHPEISSRIGNFTKYMNEVPRGSVAYNHFTSGKPHFIKITADAVRGKFSKGMRRVVNAFVNGK